MERLVPEGGISLEYGIGPYSGQCSGGFTANLLNNIKSCINITRKPGAVRVDEVFAKCVIVVL